MLIGSATCIDSLKDTIIGDDVKIDNLVQIAHNVQIGKGTMIAQWVRVGSTKIGKYVYIGALLWMAI